MQRYASSGCEIDLYTRLQHHRIIARTRMFALVREHHVALLCIGCGQQSNIAQIANTRSAEVHLPETNDNRVAIMIARAPIPAAFILRWAYLH